MIDFTEHPHKRFNPLTGQWVLVSPHRTKRPWQGQVEDATIEKKPSYDPQCYLCPGNERAGGVKNPHYDGTYVFKNDFAALLNDTPIDTTPPTDELFRAESESGECRVLCFSPRHDVTLALMEIDQIIPVINLWKAQYQELAEREDIGYVQIFENREAMMGCSNPHPHGQIWANRSIPDFPATEDCYQKAYFDVHKKTLLSDYVTKECEKKERVIFSNDSFFAVVPFWAVWPYETMIIPRKAHQSLLTLSEDEKSDLAQALREMGIRFDNLFSTMFPYSMGIHQRPTDNKNYDHWHFHIHYFPPLLRSATVRKFMVGYEMLGMPQRDITPEQSAQKLRECSTTHFLTINK